MREPIEILMIEDNLADIELTREALMEGKLTNRLHTVVDGEQALDFLYQREPYEDVPSPDIILLDLNLPKISGREVLADIKSNPDLSIIPVIVLSSSQDASDISKSYELNANSFVTKPIQADNFLEVVKKIEHFWIEVVKLPRRSS